MTAATWAVSGSGVTGRRLREDVGVVEDPAPRVVGLAVGYLGGGAAAGEARRGEGVVAVADGGGLRTGREGGAGGQQALVGLADLGVTHLEVARWEGQHGGRLVEGHQALHV